ncbi:MAG: tryptophan synthase subunit alpha [Terriglobales bacterium]
MPINFKTRPGLVAYLTCGDPDLQTTEEIALAAIEAGADVIELGVPFSDPVADGPVIQRASERALRHHTTLENVLEMAASVRKKKPSAGLIVFTYLNPIYRYGIERFAKAAKNAGVDGALVTDLTVEEAGDYLRAMRAQDLATVFLAAPTSTDERLKRIGAASTGFVYAVSRTGVTGAQKNLTVDARELVRRIKRFTSLPVAVGFGISTPEQVQEVGEFADAAVVGSAIVHLVETTSAAGAALAVGDFVRKLKRRAKRSATPA